jgi:hypothetical protein
MPFDAGLVPRLARALSGAASAPRPIPATNGDDLPPGALRLESDFRAGESGFHHFRALPSLSASASSQFSRQGLRSILAELEKAGVPKSRVVVIDLRQESHGLDAHGDPVEWMGTHNQANDGKSDDAELADEAQRLGGIGGTGEAELCRQEGVRSIRLPVTDHCAPAAATVDRFLALAEKLRAEGAWVHFHCKAGKGRTTTFMAMWEMLAADPRTLDAAAVLRHQRAVGGSDLLVVDDADAKTRRDVLFAFAERVRWRGGRDADRIASCASPRSRFSSFCSPPPP